MKTTIAAAVAVTLALTMGVVATPAKADVDVSFDMFYSNLSPHGSWLVSGSYGRVWQPRVYQPGWNPYYDGHWDYSDVGWVWVSDYRWGAVPYHYGTWVMDPRYGWVWVPGYTWAPAWVVFRTGPDAIGWAPVSPEFAINISIGGGGYYNRGYYDPYSGYGAAASASFIFVPTRQFAAPRIRQYVIPQTRNATYIQNTTIVNNNLTVVNNVVVNRGPDVRMVERVSGQRISATPVERIERVTPFRTVNRQQLAVRPEQIDRQGRGLRVTEPVTERAQNLPRQQRAFPQQQRPEERQQPQQEPRVQREEQQAQQEQPRVKRQETQPQQEQPRVKPQEPQPQQEQPRVKRQEPQPQQEQPRVKRQEAQPQQEQPRVKRQEAQPPQEQPRVKPKETQPQQEQPQVKPQEQQQAPQKQQPPKAQKKTTKKKPPKDSDEKKPPKSENDNG